MIAAGLAVDAIALVFDVNELVANAQASIEGFATALSELTFEDIAVSITTTMTTINESLVAAFDGAVATIKIAMESLPGPVGDVMSELTPIVDASANIMRTNWEGFTDTLETAMLAAGEGLDAIWTSLTETWDVVTTAIGGTWQGLSDSFNEILTVAATEVAKTFVIIGAEAGRVWGEIQIGWDEIWAEMLPLVKPFVDAITTSLEGLNAGLVPIWDQVEASVGLAITAMSGQVTGWIDDMNVSFEDWATNVGEAWEGVREQITDIVTGLIENAGEWGRNLITSFADGIIGAIGKIKEAALKVVKAIKRVMGIESLPAEGPLRNLNKWGAGVSTEFAKGITSNRRVVQDSLNSLTGPAMNIGTGGGRTGAARTIDIGGITVSIQIDNVSSDVQLENISDVVVDALVDKLNTKLGKKIIMTSESI